MSAYRFDYQCVCDGSRKLIVDSEGSDVWIKTADADAFDDGSGVLLTDPVEVEALRDQLTDWLLRNK